MWNEGALVYTGDCQARQGQGELCGVALEITSKVTVVFEVIKDKAIEWPRIESDEAIMVVGSARPMEDAACIANTELVLWLEQEYGYDRWDAYQLLTQAGGLYVGNMVDTTILWWPPLPRSTYTSVQQVEREDESSAQLNVVATRYPVNSLLDQACSAPAGRWLLKSGTHPDSYATPGIRPPRSVKPLVRERFSEQGRMVCTTATDGI